ncbi:MAG TPA: DUF72 domain-containing protein [Bryobacteraceae bacterium]|nr:DUF72 domain-containing protein [Bryobacteraceae bacterium]
MLPLFTPDFDRDGLAARLRSLAAEKIWIGASSWKYEGWLGQIYSRDRYLSRGKFSEKRFNAECLAEYAETFPVVCGDFSFYQFPSPEFWKKLFASAPASLRFALKVPEEVTCETFPKQPRYGSRAGQRNESFLNSDALQSLFLDPLTPYAARVSPLIFEFGARSTPPIAFIDRLDAFFDALPGTFRYAVEIRNREFLAPRYFDSLRAHSVAHVFNSWTRMPPLSHQFAIEAAFTADFSVTRALLRPGRAYEDAVKMFSPYDKILDENPEVRESLRALIRRMREERRAAYIFVNNRLEGNAPETIRAVIAE